MAAYRREWMTYSHLRDDFLYTEISSEPNAGIWEAFTFLLVLLVTGYPRHGVAYNPVASCNTRS